MPVFKRTVTMVDQNTSDGVATRYSCRMRGEGMEIYIACPVPHAQCPYGFVFGGTYEVRIKEQVVAAEPIVAEPV